MNQIKFVKVNFFLFLGSCPSTCKECDNLKGCVSCKTGFILYKNSCVSKCLPEMLKEIPTLCAEEKKSKQNFKSFLF